MIATLLVFVVGWSTLGYILSRYLGRMDVADIGWGAGIVVLTWILIPAPQGMIGLWVGMVTLWGLRLAFHIIQRHRRTDEDPRYAAWRTAWGQTLWWRSWLQVFVLQTSLMLLVASPAVMIAGAVDLETIAVQDSLRPNDLTSVIASVGFLASLGMAGIGLILESWSDAVLARHRQRHPGVVCRRRPWGWTRHPNYLGEVIFWWGIGLAAAFVVIPWGTPGFSAILRLAGCLVGPATITYLLLRVSGVPMMEARMRGKEKYADYLRDVPRFWPFLRPTS